MTVYVILFTIHAFASIRWIRERVQNSLRKTLEGSLSALFLGALGWPGVGPSALLILLCRDSISRLLPQQQQQPGPVHPWDVRRLTHKPLLPTHSRHASPSGPPAPSPFPRHGYVLSATASAASKLFLFGGLVHDTFRNEFYVISTLDLSKTPLERFPAHVPDIIRAGTYRHVSAILC
jgi:hypothetical protein